MRGPTQASAEMRDSDTKRAMLGLIQQEGGLEVDPNPDPKP